MSPSYERAKLLFSQGRYEMAENELRNALVQEPDNPSAYSYLALCLLERKQFREATQEGTRAVALGPDLPFPHYALSFILYRRGALEEAEAAVMEAIRLTPFDAEPFALLASIKFEQRMWPAALEAAEKGLSLDPENVRCNNLRAMALVKLGRRDEAGMTIAANLQVDPDNADTHANMGWTLLHEGQPRKAMEHFREALRLEPNLEWARLGIVEALKAHNFIYRWMLYYFLFMSRLSHRTQWIIMIGGYFGAQALLQAQNKNPSLRPIVIPLIIAYGVFAIMTWLADPIFNLLLRISRFGRLVLSRDQTRGSNLIAIILLCAVACIVTYFVTQRVSWLLLGIRVVLLMLPASMIFRFPVLRHRYLMAGATAVLTMIALATFYVGRMQVGGEDLVRFEKYYDTLDSLFIYGILASTLGANALAMMRQRQ